PHRRTHDAHPLPLPRHTRGAGRHAFHLGNIGDGTPSVFLDHNFHSAPDDPLRVYLIQTKKAPLATEPQRGRFFSVSPVLLTCKSFAAWKEFFFADSLRSSRLRG